jgi:hypothetical protein
MTTHRSIRVDAAVFEQLERRAVPFETPNNVLRRLFGMPPARPGRPRQRAPEEPEGDANADR